MGFWDAQLTSLEALGIEFSPLFEKMLEEGGQVLHLAALPIPDSTPEYVENCYDQNNEPVLVVEKIRAFPPAGITDCHEPVAVTMETEHGSDWRDYPSFVGYLEDYDRYCQGFFCSCYRSETLWFYRFWNCYPLLEDDLYRDLAQACTARIGDSLYNELRAIAEIEYDDGGGSALPIEMLWMFYNAPGDLHRNAIEDVQNFLAEGIYDVEFIHVVLQGYEAVVDAEYLPPPWYDFKRDGPFPGKHFEIPPMEPYLAGKPFALEVWRTMLADRAFAQRQICSIMTPRERESFEYHEGNPY